MTEELILRKQEIQEKVSQKLIEDIVNKLKKGEVSEATLSTDEKVLARVTDGIYRQPASAIRELISNAYDADADNVWIDTDAPRFENMTIRDDGNGMSIEVLTNLIHHIGGSAKRSGDEKKALLGVTDKSDSTLSPNKKRRLIGKIGIGLFSVAQLTRHFSIVTKRAGVDYYLIADVVLNNYSEQVVASQEKRGEGFDTGFVKIRTEKTENLAAHGTDIILKNIKKSARDQLKSVDIWLQESAELSPGQELKASRQFHIGCTDQEDKELVRVPPSLPWNESDSGDRRFLMLYNAMINRSAQTISPKLESDLDNYLGMLWTLGLSVPVDYIDKHPFMLTGAEYPKVYRLNNDPKSKAEEISLSSGETVKDYFKLETNTSSTGFNVYIDGIKLYRPVKFTGLPSTGAVVKDPILFVGAAAPDVSKYSASLTGGGLAFEAYILWCPKIIPKEHNGVLLRINNATGILFDSTFMRYQIAEHVIKGQLTIEIFVREGLDSALNIDRESFNIAHPHYQMVMRWLHDAMRKVVAKYKEIKRARSRAAKDYKVQAFTQSVDEVVGAVAEFVGKERDEIRQVEITAEGRQGIDAYHIDSAEFQQWVGLVKAGSEQENNFQEKVKSVVQVLDAFDLLEGLSESEQKALFEAISKIIGA
ncbi:High temperature protein G [Acinetobacter baumannii]|uniref:ATP-binding protein n=3 Tax=Pseudomonas aeruginosa TaxID=287 RepID=UPI00053EE87E|nr:ATP-binding protein [Pseudomonas aeruginosa]SSU85393.1 High temperature protein G [Acinetobacter baumannii]MCO3946269.1 ATP-binding protein [Pseudomonas aeruginosa]MCX2439119.1 ATP-binding protein [Pseudomonas aeruginosa]MDE9754420.1 ATP-binding protein [Pseudomonas aeruginosa]TEI33271.1 ATP-binding protein [Pseudomonas aeruginosa]